MTEKRKSRGPKVAVLGYGPAGMMATHGAVLGGAGKVDIYGTGNKSTLGGAQYLHEPVPELTFGQGVVVSYRMQGTSEGYRAKVYGPESTVVVSPENLRPVHRAWDLRYAYDNLWNMYEKMITHVRIDAEQLSALATVYDLVISSIPATALCTAGHMFDKTRIWVAATYLGPGLTPGANVVICNGEIAPAWYRSSRVFGHSYTEWPGDKRPPLPTTEFTKPTTTNCDCWTNVVRVGRFGEWRKGVLTHHAFLKARAACARLVDNDR